MARRSEIILSLTDRVSPSINSIRNSGNRLNKDLDDVNATMSDMLKHQDGLREGQVQLQATIVKTSQELRDAKKAYRELNNEQSRTNLEEVQKEYNEQRDTLRDYNRTIRETKKEIRELDDQRQRIENRAGGGEILEGLGKAGLGRLLADSAQGALDVAITSSLGSTAGSAISSVIGGALSGAAIGSMVGPLGTAIGAAVGGIGGAITGATQIFEEKDDAFKSYRQETIDEAGQELEGYSTRGIATRSQREMLARAFEGDLGQKGAEEFIAELARMDAENPFSFDDMALLSRTYFGFQLTEEQIYEQLDNIGNLGAARGLGTQDLDMVAKTLAAMPVSPSITRMDIQKLTTRGVPVLEYIGNAYGLATDEVFENLKDFDPSEIFEIITEGMKKDPKLSGAMGRLKETYIGREDMLEAAQMDMDVAYGEGYIQTRETGQLAEMDFLESEIGEAMQGSLRAMGAWEAELENKGEEIKRTIFSAIYSGSTEGLDLSSFTEEGLESLEELQREYLTISDEDGAEAGAVWQKASILAKAEYNASEGAKLQYEMEKTLVNEVTDMLSKNEDYWNAGYLLGQEFNKGLLSAKSEIDLSSGITGNSATIGGKAWDSTRGYSFFGIDGPRTGKVHRGESSERDEKPASSGGGGRSMDTKKGATPKPAPYRKPPGAAYGISYVPRDNTYIRAHEGERLQTAREARQDRQGGAAPVININITGNTFENENQIERFATMLADKLEETQGTM